MSFWRVPEIFGATPSSLDGFFDGKSYFNGMRTGDTSMTQETSLSGAFLSHEGPNFSSYLLDGMEPMKYQPFLKILKFYGTPQKN